MTAPGSRRAALLLVVTAGSLALFVGLRRDTEPPRVPSLETMPQPEAVMATPELAARTVDRLQLLRTGNAGAQLRLTADEVTAVLRHALTGMLPAGIRDPVVRMERGYVTVDARLSTDDFAGRAPLAAVLGALPDTIDVGLSGRVTPASNHLTFDVESAYAARVPLPPRAVAAIAAALAEASERRVTSSRDGASFGLRLPRGIGLVAVVGDRLVLDRAERLAHRAVDGSDRP